MCTYLIKQALQREKLANEEISRLQQAISTLLEEAGSRTRQEVIGDAFYCDICITSQVPLWSNSSVFNYRSLPPMFESRCEHI